MIRNIIIINIIILLVACKQTHKNVDNRNTPKHGIIYISVDESFKPVIEQQIKVYESSNPEAHIIATYKPEAACLKDLMVDSITMVIATRGLDDKEELFYNEKLQYTPNFGLLALDAVVAIVNKNNKDTTLTMKKLKQYINAEDTTQQIILDGLSATSTVRYVLDSLAQKNKLNNHITAAKNTQELINYVTQHNNVIGLLGLSWVGDMEDASQKKALADIKIIKMLCQLCDSSIYIKPTPLNISQHTYPMVRGLFYINKENYTGLGTGFVNFMSLERGQLIFRRSYLVPAKISFDLRKVTLN